MASERSFAFSPGSLTLRQWQRRDPFSACCRTASDSDIPRPAKASNSAHVSPADRPSSAAAGSPYAGISVESRSRTARAESITSALPISARLSSASPAKQIIREQSPSPALPRGPEVYHRFLPPGEVRERRSVLPKPIPKVEHHCPLRWLPVPREETF